ncbi:MAG: hypothetical protein JSU86_05615, partial [Phycisphaerales bacterium]
DCDDGVFCNGVETCDAVLECQPGVAVDCDDADACTADSCNEDNDVCDNDPIPCTVVEDCPVGCNETCTVTPTIGPPLPGFCAP